MPSRTDDLGGTLLVAGGVGREDGAGAWVDSLGFGAGLQLSSSPQRLPRRPRTCHGRHARLVANQAARGARGRVALIRGLGRVP